MQALLSNLICVTVTVTAILFILDLIATVRSCWIAAALTETSNIVQICTKETLPDPWLLPVENSKATESISETFTPITTNLLVLPSAKEQQITEVKRRGRPKKQPTLQTEPIAKASKRRGRPKKAA